MESEKAHPRHHHPAGSIVLRAEQLLPWTSVGPAIAPAVLEANLEAVVEATPGPFILIGEESWWYLAMVGRHMYIPRVVTSLSHDIDRL